MPFGLLAPGAQATFSASLVLTVSCLGPFSADAQAKTRPGGRIGVDVSLHSLGEQSQNPPGSIGDSPFGREVISSHPFA